MGHQIKKATDERLQIIYHPDSFSEGVRILMLTTRSKDGGRTNNPDRQPSNKKYVTRSSEEYYEKLDELIAEMNQSQRIYSTVDPRDTEKAIHKFKQNQLDADYYAEKDKFGFYDDVYNRWISSLQQPTARASRLFLYDIDDDEGDPITREEAVFLMEKGGINVLHSYNTKNGCHVITDPHDPKKIDIQHQKNSMLLVAYYESGPIKQLEVEKTELPEYKGRT